jgi:hypothetical protein
MQTRTHCARERNKTRTKIIQKLNDEFRQTLEGGHIYLTDGVLTLGPAATDHVVEAVRQFTEFNSGNDPYPEHDFGSIWHAGERIFWKIDYYDRSLQLGSPDPADPLLTTRVLTIMLACEY